MNRFKSALAGWIFTSILAVFLFCLTGCPDPVKAETKPTYVTYYVRYWTQNINANYDDGYEEKTFSDVILGTNVSITDIYAEREGFHLREDSAALIKNQQCVDSDGKIFNVYYERNTYTITFDFDGGLLFEDSSRSYSGFYEKETSLENYRKNYWTPYKDGYTFAGWDKEIPEYYTQNITITALWEKITSATYQVIYYTEKLEEENGEILYAETGGSWLYTGTIDEKTAVTGDEFFDNYPVYLNGFYLKPIEQQVIKADGSTIVKVYLRRKTFTYSFDTDGGTEIAPITGKYEQVIEIEDPVKEGFKFKGWTPELGEMFGIDFYGHYKEGDITFKANWQETPKITVTVNIIKQDDLSIEVTQNGTEFIFTSSMPDLTNSWDISFSTKDSGSSSRNGSESTFTVDTADWKPGIYWCYLYATNYETGIRYSARAEITVTAQEQE